MEHTGQSATGTAAATRARALLADLQASSATPDIAATLAALVALTATISGTTTPPDRWRIECINERCKNNPMSYSFDTPGEAADSWNYLIKGPR